jgi:Domain of unknown function (DUF2017)
VGRRIRRHRRGHVVVELDEHERQILVDLVDQLRTLLMSGTEPSLRRLFPIAYPNDEHHEREYQSLVQGALLEHRLATLDVFEATLPASSITVAELESWMGALNDLRLVLGTLLDVSEDETDFDPEADNAFGYAIYHFLGGLLEQAVDVLFSTLPPDPSR